MYIWPYSEYSQTFRRKNNKALQNAYDLSNDINSVSNKNKS